MANPKICSIQDCDKPAIKRAMCSAHYQRWRTHGDVTAGRTSKGVPLKWLHDHVGHASSDACLPWPFARYSDGRGHIIFAGRHANASRVMCQLVHGEPPTPKHEAAHLCGKGHEGCVNPHHLSWKTHVENQADKLIHGTHDRGERHYSAKLTEQNVKFIRRMKGVVPQRDLADRFDVCVSHICNIQNREEWVWLK